MILVSQWPGVHAEQEEEPFIIPVTVDLREGGAVV